MKKKLLIILLFPVSIMAQVTIGSNLKPNEGALLDLKERESKNEITANRGLGLPRVTLTDISRLSPMYSYENGDNPNPDNLAEHIGLVVYNINMTENDPESCPVGVNSGTFVWNGEYWVFLTKDQDGELIKGVHPNRHYKVSTLVDTRDPSKPETYEIAKFGKMWWMIENLRADREPDGTKMTRAYTADQTEKVLCYNYPIKAFNAQRPLDPSSDLVERNPEYGYMYSWKAAVNGQRTVDTNDDPLIQGICPDGWFLPRREDWVNLFDEIENNICSYALSPSADVSQIHERTSIALLSTRRVEDGEAISYIKEGESRSYEEGGINLLPTGIVAYATATGENSYYGYGALARIWTSTIEGKDNAGYKAYMVSINVGNLSPGGIYDRQLAHWYIGSMIPVRCMKYDK